MANLFTKQPVRTPREDYEQKYNSSRGQLLFVLAMTVINIVLLVSKSDLYFLFSAFIPYFLVDLGMYMCGMYPSEYYLEDGFDYFLFSTYFF